MLAQTFDVELHRFPNLRFHIVAILAGGDTPRQIKKEWCHAS